MPSWAIAAWEGIFIFYSAKDGQLDGFTTNWEKRLIFSTEENVSVSVWSMNYGFIDSVYAVVFSDRPHLPTNALEIEGTIEHTGSITVLGKTPIFHTCPNN